jgi:hypothetical protein
MRSSAKSNIGFLIATSRNKLLIEDGSLAAATTAQWRRSKIVSRSTASSKQQRNIDNRL